MTLSKVIRTARRVQRARTAVRDPAAYARRRATSKALGAVGFWRAWGRLWR